MKGIKTQFKIENNFILFQIMPSLLWFYKPINEYIVRYMPELSEFHGVDNVLHVIVLFAAVFSFVIALGFSKYLLNSISFAILWICYNSVFVLGGVFMQFQWDILLLEAGFLTIFFAPLWPTSTPGPFTKIIREMIRWMVFRLMIGSGLTKLLSG